MITELDKAHYGAADKPSFLLAISPKVLEHPFSHPSNKSGKWTPITKTAPVASAMLSPCPGGGLGPVVVEIMMNGKSSATPATAPRAKSYSISNLSVQKQKSPLGDQGEGSSCFGPRSSNACGVTSAGNV
jgi:hypothetical protein